MPKQQTNIFVFGGLLLVLLALTFAFGSGALRFGFEGPLVYAFYIVAGLLVAVTCFGLLHSYGSYSGNQASGKLEMGGAIVGFCLVVIGGGLYERYWHLPSSFNIQVITYQENKTEPVFVSGEISLLLGQEKKTEHFTDPGRALFQNISSQWYRKDVPYVFSSPAYSVLEPASIILDDKAPVYIKIGKRKQFASIDEASLDLEFEEAGAAEFGPKPDSAIINVRFRASTTSPLIVPVGPKAKFEVLSSSLTPVLSADMTVNEGKAGNGAHVTPSEPLEIFVEGFCSKAKFEQFYGGSFLWQLTFTYDPVVSKSDAEKTFRYGPVAFTLPFINQVGH